MNCPITEIFVANANLNDTIKNDARYTVLTYDEKDFERRYLVYSKETNNLPLSTLTINSRPCLNPTLTESQSDSFYPTENDLGKHCGNETDPRYRSDGM